MIEVVTFDLWQTLIYETAEQEERRRLLRYQRIKALLSGRLELDYDSFFRAHSEVWEKCQELWKTNRDFSSRQQAILFLRCLLQTSNGKLKVTNSRSSPIISDPSHDVSVPHSHLYDPRIADCEFSDEIISKLEHAYTDVIFDEVPHLFDGAKEILEELSTRGIRIGLICNTGRTPGRCLREVLKQLGIFNYFGALTFSDEFLIRKPDVRIFRATLEKLGSRNALHVGDNPVADVLGAKNAGMFAVHIVRAEELQPSPDADACIRDLRELSRVIR